MKINILGIGNQIIIKRHVNMRIFLCLNGHHVRPYGWHQFINWSLGILRTDGMQRNVPTLTIAVLIIGHVVPPPSMGLLTANQPQTRIRGCSYAVPTSQASEGDTGDEARFVLMHIVSQASNRASCTAAMHKRIRWKEWVGWILKRMGL